MKKALKIFAIIFGVILLIIIALPFVLKGKVVKIIEDQANAHLNAKLELGGVNLSLIKSFPDLSLSITNLKITGVDEFENIKLADIGEIYASLNVMSVIGGDQIKINSLGLDNPKFHVLVLKNGKANYDIAKESGDTTSSEEEVLEDTGSSEESAPLKIQLKEYYIRNAQIVYDDREGDMFAELVNFTHTGKGDFTLDEFLLETKTTADELTFKMEGMHYLKKAKLDIDFNTFINMPESRYTFKENAFRINELVLKLDGWVHMPEEHIDMDLTFATENTAFKSVLSLIPDAYTADFNDVKTKGNFEFNGMAKGIFKEENEVMTLPSFDVKLVVSNAFFQYPDLPKAAENIAINMRAYNPGGSDDNTVVDIKQFYLQLADNPIDFKMLLKTPISDPDMDGELKMQLNLASLKDVLPQEEGESYTGSITSDLSFKGRLSSIENEKYDEFHAKGQVIILDLDYASADFAYPIQLKKMYLDFSPQHVNLSAFEALLGKSDISANGKIDNMFAYYFKDEALSGSFNMNSNLLDINELMPAEEPATGEPETNTTQTGESSSEEVATEGVFMVPHNIDFALNTNIKKLIYDNIEIENVQGKVSLRDEVMALDNLKMNLLSGLLNMSGSYSTKDTELPKVDFNMNISKFDIEKTVETFNSVEKLAPILASAKGAFSMQFAMNGMLDDSMNMDLNTLNGKGRLNTHNVIVDNDVLKKIDDAVKTKNFNPLQVSNVDVDFEIKDGRIETKPFKIKSNGIESEIEGYTTLEQKMDYTINTEIPTALFGSSAAQLTGALSSQLQSLGLGEAKLPEKLKVGIKVTGDVSNPEVRPQIEGVKGAASSAKEQAKEMVKEKIEEVKEDVKKKAAEEAAKILADAQAQVDRIVAEAKVQADRVRAEGKNAGNQIRQETNKQAQDLVNKASNPLQKVAAEKAADKLRDEGEQKAKKVEAEANAKANDIEQKAKNSADKIMDDARARAENATK